MPILTTTETKNKNIRVFVADDHKILLGRVANLLSHHFEVVGTAADGKAALEAIQSLKPDVAVLDISMPVINGIEVAEELKKSGSEVKVVMLTGLADSSYKEAAFSAGATALVVKTQIISDLITAVESAWAGKHSFLQITETMEI